MKRLAVALAAATLALSSLANAQQAGSGRGVITLGEVKIIGRVQKPVASVDVSKIQVKLTLGELKQPFVDRIEKAIESEPF